ncbi:hypothetical protein ABK040_011365 [Willaertia magna]
MKRINLPLFYSDSNNNEKNKHSDSIDSPSILEQTTNNKWNNNDEIIFFSNNSNDTNNSKINDKINKLNNLTINVHLFIFKLLIFIFLNILFFEILVYRFQFTYFPDIYSMNKNDENIKKVYNILLIADPQLTDNYSYNLHKSQNIPKIVKYLLFFITDIFMKKNIKSIYKMNLQNLNCILFLGDLFDSGRILEDDEFQLELQRFFSIFGLKQGEDKLYLKLNENIPILVGSGNHDIGLYGSHFKNFDFLEKRFLQNFKNNLNFNFLIENTNVELIGLNTMYFSTIKNFLDKILKQTEKENTKFILFSHIPLFREKYCLNNEIINKQKKRIKSQYGVGYQNVVSESDTQYLLRKINPFIVLSGDDHEYCKIDHEINDKLNLDNNESTNKEEEKNIIYEHTIPTFSFLQGTKKCGYGVLSLNFDKLNNLYSYDLNIYYLPQVWNIYIYYGILSIFVTLYFFIYLKMKYFYKKVLIYFGLIIFGLVSFLLCNFLIWMDILF